MTALPADRGLQAANLALLFTTAALPFHYVPHGRLRSGIGVACYLLGGALGWLVTPAIALAVFLLLPAFYFITSEGIPVARKRRTHHQ